MIKTASYYEKARNSTVICRLCPAGCKLTEGKAGICRNRFNRGGELVTDNYGELVTIAIDPIEKKPLYHFYPAREILSTGANGCNLGCVHCQNWSISQEEVKTMYVSPQDLVRTARQHDSIGVAFTYTEPMIWFEYIRDTAPLLGEEGMKVVLVTNGYINREPLEDLLPFIDAANVDLKSIRSEHYKKVCKGKLEPVLQSIEMYAKAGVHLEITNLIVPGMNDSDDDITDLVDFVASVSNMIPLHFSAYHPDYRLTVPPTPMDTMLNALEIASKKLKYVYLGNVVIAEGCDTKCPKCGHLLISRNRYSTSIKGLSGSRCAKCDGETGIVQ